MVSIYKMEVNILKVLFLFALMQHSPGVCQDIEDGDREKRTIGVLFRTFVDAFQPQRQPAPMVYSYQPPRQNRPQAQAQQVQSAKADLLSSSKTIFQQKKNLFKPPATQAPDTELVTPTVSRPTVATQAPNPAPQVVAPYTDQGPPPSPPPQQDNPFQNVVPLPGHHPLMPLKAQILIIPFQGKPGAPFPGLELEPRLPSAEHAPPFNYQAEIYLHPPHNGVYPSFNQYPARYSPSNGWHDAGDILSRGIQSGYDNEGRQDAGVISLTNPDRPEQQPAAFNNNGGTPPVESAPSQIPNGAVAPLQNQQENDIESRRRDNNIQRYYEGQRYNLEQPLFLPNFQSEGSQINNVNFEQQAGNFLTTPFSDNGFVYSGEERTQTPQNIQSNNAKDENPQSGSTNPRPKQIKGVNSIPPHRNINNAHDYLPQRGGYQKYPESVGNNAQYQQQTPQGSYNENQIQYPEQQQYQQYPGNGFDIQQQQYPTRIGMIPAGPMQHQSQLASQGYQHVPDLQDVQAIANMSFGGQNYYKRSNSDEKHTTKNCSDCNKNK